MGAWGGECCEEVGAWGGECCEEVGAWGGECCGEVAVCMVLSYVHDLDCVWLLSDFSDNLVFKSGAGVPSAPPQPILVEAGVCSLGLKWTPPDDNGSPITSYCLEMNDPEAVI